MQQNKRARTRFTALWPAYAVIIGVGLFVAAVGGIWVFNHLIKNQPIGETAWVVLGASGLRLATVALAIISLKTAKQYVVRCMVYGSLWAVAAAQLIYPLAETVAKLLALAGVLDLPPKGVGDMSAEGWFNFAMAWIIFGIPGLLFGGAALSYGNRNGIRSRPIAALFVVGGVLALLGIGLVIG